MLLHGDETNLKTYINNVHSERNKQRPRKNGAFGIRYRIQVNKIVNILVIKTALTKQTNVTRTKRINLLDTYYIFIDCD